MFHTIEEYIIKDKGINANVDLYSASVYHLMGIPTDLFTPVFAVSRMAGWTAHILEQYENNRLIRPRADYTGLRGVPFTPMEQRPAPAISVASIDCFGVAEGVAL